ncbi:metallophosphoesterase [Siculibacillus lacustris]|uniref:Metallophosphoesterase n=1 Tax=Siculibacillus lacustris TaxID=1549641 RepID=A0A4Q9VIH4_9HYPH|nr:metallophosphoesterase [Siculibacillus lacustris]TBW34515.1 metallophosphoesterase [Siculibacillus lacustris]
MITRRRLLTTLLAGTAGCVTFGGYAVAVEPRMRLTVTRNDLALPGWPAHAKPLKVAMIADLHAVEPWMPISRIEEIVVATNALQADVILLLGDYMSGVHFAHRVTPPREWAAVLAKLTAPLGVHAILGNHDYWWRGGPDPVVRALREVGIDVLLNQATRIDAHGHRFWITGTESTLAGRLGAHGFVGRDDLSATLARISDDLPVLHMAHEPDLFAEVPERVALTVSGHTHGGQVGIPGVRGLIALRTGSSQRWIRGHYEVGGRHLLVSSGLGVSFLPMRFLVPPEINLVHIRSAATA